MKKNQLLWLMSLIFFLSAGVFFALGQGWLAAVDVAIGLVIGGLAWRRRAGG